MQKGEVPDERNDSESFLLVGLPFPLFLQPTIRFFLNAFSMCLDTPRARGFTVSLHLNSPDATLLLEHLGQFLVCVLDERNPSSFPKYLNDIKT